MQVPYRKLGKYALMKSDPMLTIEKIKELEAKLDRLKNYSRPKGAEEVKRLAEFGDFSENVEYQLAKGKLRGINNAITTIENQLKNARVIEPNLQNEVVQIGHQVTIKLEGKPEPRADTRSGSGAGEKTYLILGSTETDPQKGVISHVSPLGSALIGKKIGEIVILKIMGKEVGYKITKID
jgi:transcription elongation factor GreA